MNLSKEKAIKMLEEIYSIALNSSMTGSLHDGCGVLYMSYNKIREAAINNGWIDGEWVVELKKGELLCEDDNWMDVIGTAAKLLMVQLEDDFDENGFKIKDAEETEETGEE